MKAKFTKKIGTQVFEFECDATSQKEFIQSVSFYSSLPEVGPNGEDDLVLRHRPTKKGAYYSIVSEKAKQEFMLGQYLEPKGKDELFCKGWQPLWNPEAEEGSSDSSQNYDLSEGLGGLGDVSVPTPKPATKATKATSATKVSAPKAPTAPKVSAPKVTAPTPVEMAEVSSDDSDAQSILAQFIGG